jgi:hypothetical protein
MKMTKKRKTSDHSFAFAEGPSAGKDPNGEYKYRTQIKPVATTLSTESESEYVRQSIERQAQAHCYHQYSRAQARAQSGLSQSMERQAQTPHHHQYSRAKAQICLPYDNPQPLLYPADRAVAMTMMARWPTYANIRQSMERQTPQTPYYNHQQQYRQAPIGSITTYATHAILTPAQNNSSQRSMTVIETMGPTTICATPSSDQHATPTTVQSSARGEYDNDRRFVPDDSPPSTTSISNHSIIGHNGHEHAGHQTCCDRLEPGERRVSTDGKNVEHNVSTSMTHLNPVDDDDANTDADTKITSWRERLHELRCFMISHGHFDVPITLLPLGPWVEEQRQDYFRKKYGGGESSKLTDEQEAMLNALGVKWGGSNAMSQAAAAPATVNRCLLTKKTVPELGVTTRMDMNMTSSTGSSASSSSTSTSKTMAKERVRVSASNITSSSHHQSKSESEKHEVQPSLKDILCGRSMPAQRSHPGNVMFDQLMKSKIAYYFSLRYRRDKKSFTRKTLVDIKNSGTRFLTKRVADSGFTWEEVTDEVAHQKISTKLRTLKYKVYAENLKVAHNLAMSTMAKEAPSPVAQKPTTRIMLLHPAVKDIVCGRGTTAREYTGSLLFDQLMKSKYDFYWSLEHKQDKNLFTRKTLKEIKDSGSRFLAQDEDGTWGEVADKVALRKVGDKWRTLKYAQELLIE